MKLENRCHDASNRGQNERVSKYFFKDLEAITPIKEKPFNLNKECVKLIKRSERLYDQGKKKDAYELLSYSIRYFYSHKMDLKKEFSNFQILRFIQDVDKNNISDVKLVLNTASMIEFAKGTAKKEIFDKSINIAYKLIIVSPNEFLFF